MNRTSPRATQSDLAGVRGRGTSYGSGGGGFFRYLLAAAFGAAAAGVCIWFTPLRAPVGRALAGAQDGPPPAGAGAIPHQDAPEPEVVEKVVERVVEKVVKVPVPQPAPDMPAGPVRYRKIEVADLFNGIKIESELQSEVGTVASRERLDRDAYEAEFRLRVRVPVPNSTFSEIARLNPHLGEALPGMPALVEAGSPSKFYHHLYDLKQRQVQQRLTRLESVLSRHNFYDCDTVLELTHADSGRKVFFIQGEMDVVSDGSDGDRLDTMPAGIATSSHFQATTSYGWPKRTRTQNPMVPILEEKLAAAKERYKVKGLTRAENKSLEDAIKSLPRVIQDLASRSYLIGTEDPFIVIPLSTREYLGRNSFIPRVGDYAVVVHGKRLFPAIVGDYGPTTKVGEASLRIAKEIDPDSSPYRRPVSDLEVSYLVFPGTAQRPFGPPDYDAWRERCHELLDEIGGLGEGYELHAWEDRLTEEEPEPEPETEPELEVNLGQEPDGAGAEEPTAASPAGEGAGGGPAGGEGAGS